MTATEDDHLILSEQRARNIIKYKWTVCQLILICCADLGFSFGLVYLYRSWEHYSELDRLFASVFVFSVFRSVLVAVGTVLAVKLGVPAPDAVKKAFGAQSRQHRDDLLGNGNARVAPARRAARQSARATNLKEPLLQTEFESDRLFVEPENTAAPSGSTSFTELSTRSRDGARHSAGQETDLEEVDLSGLFGREDLLKADEETNYRRAVKKVEARAHIWRNVILCVIFAGVAISNLVCCAWFVNKASFLKAVAGSNTYLALPVHGWLVVGIMAAVAGEFFCAKNLVFRATADAGVLIQHVHPHKLYFHLSVESRFCGNCRRRFRGLEHGREGYACKICDFVCCVRCFKLSSVDRGEGILRSDKGPKPLTEYSILGYLSRALRLSVPFLHWLACSFLLLVTTQFVELLLPNYQGKVIDDVFRQDRSSFARHITVFCVGSVLTASLSVLAGLCVQVVQKNLEVGLRLRLVQSILGQDIAFFDGMMTGQISSRIQSDTQQLVSPCYTILHDGLSNVILLIGCLYMCLNTSWQLTTLALSSIGPIVTITNSYANWAHHIWSTVWQALSEASSTITQAIMNIRSVRAFATEADELAKYQEALNVSLRCGLLNAAVASLSGFFSRLTELAIGALILAIGGKMAMDGSGSLTVGQLVAFQLYWNKMDGAYRSLNGMINQLIQTTAAAERVFSLMELKPDIETLPKMTLTDSLGRKPPALPVVEESGRYLKQPSGKLLPLADAPNDIVLKGVHFRYQMRPQSLVLKGVDLTIPAGSVCAFVGRSGGGKSTLIHLIQRFYDPTEGSIACGGIDLRNIDLQWYRGQIGVVAQDTQLFNLSIRDNITYGCSHPVTLPAIVNAAKKACLHDFIVSLDEGYNARAGERGTRLSGGQKQRVAIARALLRRPRLLLLDEATSSLDAESEAQVQKALDNMMQDMAGKCTIILVAHRLSTVINSDRIFVVDDGRIAESGTHEQLLNRDGIYASLVKQQLAKKNNQISESV